jgi:hypothetical protein
MDGQLGDQRPQYEITSDSAGYKPKMSHLFPPDVGNSDS